MNISTWLTALGAGIALTCLAGRADAQVAVGDGGTPSFSRALAVPPGVAGMSPKLALLYSAGGVNGPVGYGWSLQGLSMITRCAATVAVDGAVDRAPVRFLSSDKLCLDGQRLIQTDAAGTVAAFPQVNDANGGAFGTREFRTEKDSFARVRAYGVAVPGDPSAGPAYFKVWTKSGQIYEYGASPTAGAGAAGALITNRARIGSQTKTVAMVWAVTRISDTLGNFIDFRYEQRDLQWGSGASGGTPVAGREWNLLEIQYSGNKVVFGYDVAADGSDLRPDKAEVFQQGAKNVNARRLKFITTYIDSPNTDTAGPAANALAVSTLKLSYDQGPVTGRSRVIQIQECAGAPASTRCMPATSFAYSPGTAAGVSPTTAFNLKAYKFTSSDSKYGVLVGDFNGDGLSDLLRWSETAGTENELWLSRGDGSFVKSTTFTITDVLIRADGCYQSMVVDANGDGLHDLVRIPSSVANNGITACGVPMQADYYINAGNGQFTRNTLSIGSTPIAVERKTSKWKRYLFCNAIPRQPAPEVMPSAAECQNPRFGIGWPAGATFFFVDADGDGKLDLVTSTVADHEALDPAAGVPDTALLTAFLSCTGCTKVYLATNGVGQFQEVANHGMKDFTVYADPGSGSDLQSLRRVLDQNGDGLADLVGVGSPYKKASWRSKGTGDFVSSSVAWSCDVPIDFNGDGRADCIQPSADASTNHLTVSDTIDILAVPTFNLISAGEELGSDFRKPVGQNFGSTILDVDGDGRQDILRWHDDPSLNRYYRSLGDGRFVNATYPGGDVLTQVFAGIQLKHSNAKYDFVAGDFTGRGVLELLRTSQEAPDSTDEGKRNQLYLATAPAGGVPAAPDMLTQVTTGTGATTTLKYASINNSASAVSTDKRYTSDRLTANAATGRSVDLSFPLWVVTTMEVDSGLGSPGSIKVPSEFSYVGMKADIDGRGLLGFREVRRQVSAPNGQPLTTVTRYLQQHPYIGVASENMTLLGTVNQVNASVLSSTVNIYCDKTAVAGAEGSANASAPCATRATLNNPPNARQHAQRAFA